MPNQISIEQLLAGTSTGRRQTVGHMEVIPIINEQNPNDESFSPPEVEIGTTDYGTVRVHNNTDQPTVVPTGAGWVVKEAAQDHAIGSAVILPGKSEIKITTARCIQQSQGGHISKQAHDMLILPMALRPQALSTRKETGYDKLWGAIDEFNDTYQNLAGRDAHLEFFLKSFKKELDEFVAEFELVPNQVGAIVMVNGTIVGIERAPSAEFWNTLWEPLIRVCYGSLAIKARQMLGDVPSPARVPLNPEKREINSLEDLEKVLESTTKLTENVTGQIVNQVQSMLLSKPGQAEMKYEDIRLFTVANPGYSGQYVMNNNGVKYASLCANVSNIQ